MTTSNLKGAGDWTVEDDKGSVHSPKDDPVFQSIQQQLSRNNSIHSSCSTLASEAVNTDDGVTYADNFLSVPYGFLPKSAYEHSKKHTDIIGVTYNGRTREFIILDSKGVTLWSKDAFDESDSVKRALEYPRYEYRLLTNIIYARKHNVFFALSKDFTLKVLNKDFEEICHVRSDLTSILFMIFNPVSDELITGGVAGARIWSFQQVAEQVWTEIKHMANYRLILKTELKNVGGSWVKRVELDLQQQYLYCCSDLDLHAYDMDGKLQFQFLRAHSASITGCVYSPAARLLVTTSVDTEVKVWSVPGGLINTFRGHAYPVTNVILHPETSMLFLTSALDGTVRLWSLDTMECLYSLTASLHGIIWMGMTDDNFLYLGTLRNVTLWSVNRVATFWNTARTCVRGLTLAPREDKATRVLAHGDDCSMRVFSRKTRKNLSTVLPAPVPSIEQTECGCAYNRLYSVAYILMNPQEIWLYTTRTDPACRMAVWDVFKIQQELLQSRADYSGSGMKPGSLSKGPSHRATLHGHGNEGIAACSSVCFLNSPATVWTEDEGFVCPIQHAYLLLGLADGRILFMDPVILGKKYFEFKANKDAVLDMKHDTFHDTLMTLCSLGSVYHIQVWSLPQLNLLHQVFTTRDLVGFVRLNNSIVTGHKNGTVISHELINVYDNAQNVNITPAFNDDMSVVSTDSVRADHSGPVLSIDICHTLQLVATCSGDGMIKIWQENKVLLTEIHLDDTLSVACFLDDRGDLLVGFKNHIFFIDSKKVCPKIPRPDHIEEWDKESDVYEDPAVKYEGFSENTEPVDLKTYLVPFDIEFSKDFIEGKKSLISKENLDEEDEEECESELSCAPTDIYASPAESPGRLSLVDLTLDRDASKYDLRKQMALMLQGKPALMGPATTTTSSVRFADDEAADEEMRSFEFPRFGLSPGPTPSPSTPSVCTPTSCMVSDGGETSEEEQTQVEKRFKPISKPSKESPVDIKLDRPVAEKATPKATKPAEDRPPIAVLTSSTTVKSVAKETPKQQVKPVSKVADHEHVPKSAVKPEVVKKEKKVVKKKQAKTVRKRPATSKHRRSSKPVLESDEEDEERDQRDEQSHHDNLHIRLRSALPSGRGAAAAEVGAKKASERRHLIGSLPSESPLPQSELDQLKSGESISEGSLALHTDLSGVRPSSGVRFKESGDRGLPKQPNYSRAATPSSRSSTGLLDIPQDGSMAAGDDLVAGQRSCSPTIYSDYGSEWTVPEREDLTHPLQVSLSGEEERKDYMFGARAASSFAGRPGTPVEGVPKSRPRPHTASVFPQDKQTLERMFYEALEKYRGSPDSPEYVEKLYQNDGKKFCTDYHYRLIERHHLLRMQRELRAQSATEKRQLLERRKRYKQTALAGHHRCNLPNIPAKSTTDAMLDLLQDMLSTDGQSTKQEDFKNRQRREIAAHPSIPRNRTQSARPSTTRHREQKKSRPHTAAAAASSSFTSASQLSSSDHPTTQDSTHSFNTYGSVRYGGSLPDEVVTHTEANRPQSAVLIHKHQLGSELPFRLNVSITKKEAPAPLSDRSVKSAPIADEKKATPKSSGHTVPVVTIQNRCKINEDKLPSNSAILNSFQSNKLKSSASDGEIRKFDQLFAPPKMYRPTQSIPSKCSQYILVGAKKMSQEIVASPLEEQLILERFPELQKKWIPGGPNYRKGKTFNIPYSPATVT